MLFAYCIQGPLNMFVIWSCCLRISNQDESTLSTVIFLSGDQLLVGTQHFSVHWWLLSHPCQKQNERLHQHLAHSKSFSVFPCALPPTPPQLSEVPFEMSLHPHRAVTHRPQLESRTQQDFRTFVSMQAQCLRRASPTLAPWGLGGCLVMGDTWVVWFLEPWQPHGVGQTGFSQFSRWTWRWSSVRATGPGSQTCLNVRITWNCVVVLKTYYLILKCSL